MRIEAADGGTTIPGPGETSFDRGAEAAVEALPSESYDFLDWTGDVPDAQRTASHLNLVMDADRTIRPRFARIEAPANLEGTRLTLAFRPVSVISLGWEPSPGEVPAVKYRIFEVAASGVSLIGEIPASSCRFVIRKATRFEGAVYAVCAVTASGREGARAMVTVR